VQHELNAFAVELLPCRLFGCHCHQLHCNIIRKRDAGMVEWLGSRKSWFTSAAHAAVINTQTAKSVPPTANWRSYQGGLRMPRVGLKTTADLKRSAPHTVTHPPALTLHISIKTTGPRRERFGPSSPWGMKFPIWQVPNLGRHKISAVFNFTQYTKGIRWQWYGAKMVGRIASEIPFPEYTMPIPNRTL